MNFNFSNKAEYKLNTSLINEVINLYGIKVKYIITEKVNQDFSVFGDYSHLKSDSKQIFDMFALPETSESFDISSFNFDEFGFTSYENCNLFVATKSFENVSEMKDIVGNLFVFPNNKVFEITNIDWMTPGINNLYTFNDAKSVYKLSCKPYDFKLINELNQQDLINEFTGADAEPELPKDPNYDSLDGYFAELSKQKQRQDTEAELKDTATVTIKGKDADTKDKKPLYNKDEVDIWNGY